MGLDMYLSKKKKGVKIDYDNETYEEWKDRQVGYWRKANMIHQWFVDTVQDGEDDCGVYTVTELQLKDLLSRCGRILRETKLIDTGKTEKVWDMETHQEVDQPVREVEDPDLCEELLPTQSGFFFGDTNYDEWYYHDILDTYVIVRNVLENTNFEEEEVQYSSSW